MTVSGSALATSVRGLASVDSAGSVASAASVVSAASAASVETSGADAASSTIIGLAAIGARSVEVNSGEELNELSSVSPKKAATLLVSTSLQVVRRERSAVVILGFAGVGRIFFAGSDAGKNGTAEGERVRRGAGRQEAAAEVEGEVVELVPTRRMGDEGSFGLWLLSSG